MANASDDAMFEANKWDCMANKRQALIELCLKCEISDGSRNLAH